MKLNEIAELARKHDGCRTPGKNNEYYWFGSPVVEKVFPFRFWDENDRDRFVAELPKDNFRAQGPCDEAEYCWVYVRPDDVIGLAHWEGETLKIERDEDLR